MLLDPTSGVFTFIQPPSSSSSSSTTSSSAAATLSSTSSSTTTSSSSLLKLPVPDAFEDNKIKTFDQHFWLNAWLNAWLTAWLNAWLIAWLIACFILWLTSKERKNPCAMTSLETTTSANGGFYNPVEWIIICIYLSFLSVLGTAGNALVLVVFYRKKDRQVSNATVCFKIMFWVLL